MASGSTNSCKVDPEPEKIEAQPLTVENHPNQTPDYHFVDQPDQDYFCPVSLELLTQPHQTDCCGHHISQQAVHRLSRDNKPCPMCKEHNFTTHSDKFFKRKVCQLKVYCLYTKSGCEWIGMLGELDQHTTSCPKRPWMCPYCPFQSNYDVGADHAPHCDYQPVPCPNHCQVDTIPRCHVEKHLLTCPLQLVDCQFASAGCDVRVPRKDLAGHMTENAQHHLMTATLLNLQLTRDLYQKMEEKDKQIVEFKEELKTKIDKRINHLFIKLDTKLQQHTCDLDTKLTQTQLAIELSTSGTMHTFILTEFPKHKTKSRQGSWFSNPVYNYPGGYKFQLKIDTNGVGPARETHISAYLYLLKGDNDKKLHWPVKLKVTLEMVSQENNDHYSVTDILDFNQTIREDYRCIGNTSKFYPLGKLEQNHYLKYDEIKFRLWLKMIP